MPFCNQCSTVVAQNEPEVDDYSIDISDTTLMGSAILVIKGECGDDLKQAEFSDLEASLEDEHTCAEIDCPRCDGHGAVVYDKESDEAKPAEEETEGQVDCDDCGGSGKVTPEYDGDGDHFEITGGDEFEVTDRTESSGPAWRYVPHRVNGIVPMVEKLVRLKRNMKPRPTETVEVVNGKRFVKRQVPKSFDRLADIDPRTGKQRIKQWGYRFARRYYGVTATVDIRCTVCNEDFQVTLEDEVAASGMEEC